MLRPLPLACPEVARPLCPAASILAAGLGSLGGLSLVGGIALSLAEPVLAAAAAPPPNVLLIAVDDLNDWVGAFAGNPQAVTPNLDGFAEKGAVVFQRAYCPGPVCGPSRSAMLSGFMPHRTGIYGNQQNMLNSPLVQRHATLPEYFGRNGYVTVSSGKIFHKHLGPAPGTTDEGHWAFHRWVRESGSDRVRKDGHYSRGEGLLAGKPDPSTEFRSGAGSEFEWGPLEGREEDMKDTRTARWAAAALAELPTAQPFFLAVGISQPHLPWIVPQAYFDRHPLGSIRIPEHRPDDLDDIRTPAGAVKFAPTDDYRWVSRDPDLFRRCVQAYLAASSYADACVGIILDALERSPHRDRTIVVIFGDHGWHLGEKLRFRKATLWQEATRLPLMIRTPGVAGRRDSPRVVNLIDLYPTLVEFCGLPEKAAGTLDGRSLVPLLRNPTAEWPHPTLVIDPGGRGAAAISETAYLIRHRDGTEELYDMAADPLQWRNLAGERELPEERARLARILPDAYAPPIPADKGGARRGTPDPALPAMRAAADLR